MTADDTAPMKSVTTALQILETLQEAGTAGVSEIADASGQPKSTVHRHLDTFRECGYVVKEDRSYSVSLKTLRLASSALSRQLVYPVTKSVVNELAAETGESAAVAVEERGRGVYLYYDRTDQAVRTDARIGIRLHLHCTGAGKAIFAHLPEERRNAIVEAHGLPAKTAQTITDRGELEDELAEIRETGIAFDDEERVDGMRGVGTPIRNRETGELLGALTVAGPTRRINGDRFREELPDLLRRAAKMVEVNITYS
ncbi:IclR family transcriptional regulator [Halosolutus gelatinilyticus]|uniref:IclR family transcriptional regulator n=1 Tax=Halosolutus gelatinilyticus TaxID=2931975 RepID=UPI001FF2093F|nr:IclR family transcriptional regulator [Halosolutus gelatinilyticus]